MSAERTTMLRVEDLCCAAEEQQIRAALGRVPGIRTMSFDIVKKTVVVRHDVDSETVAGAIQAAGFTTTPIAAAPEVPAHTPFMRIWTVAGAVTALMAGVVLEHTSGGHSEATVLYLASILISGWPIVQRAGRSAVALRLDVNVLMTGAAIGAAVLGQYAEAAAVLVLYALSMLLESLSVDRTQRAIRDLLSLTPPVVTLVTSEGVSTVAAETVRAGNIVLVRPGQRIPVDGTVARGSTSVDESPITGESLPVFKSQGSHVYAGSLNGRGAVEILVTTPQTDTLLHRIVSFVEEARAKKTEIQNFTERFAKYYVPGVFAAAVAIAFIPPVLGLGGWADWFYRSLTVLVISCPCALLLSTPVAVVSAVTGAVRTGVLIRGGSVLDHLARVRSVAMDKTGTLTHGRHDVTSIVRLDSLTEEEILRTTAAIELRSEHPLADALVREAGRRGISIELEPVERFEAVPGKGVRAVVGGRMLHVGNHQYVEDLRICSPALEQRIADLEAGGQTVLVLADDTRPLGMVSVKDRTRDESQAVVQRVRTIVGGPVVLLTGDNRATAEALGRSLGVDAVHHGLLPEDKVRSVEILRREHGSVAMVGDGINDAPALATADVGIAMGGTGTEEAIRAADVVLMNGGIGFLPYLFRLGRRTHSVILTNIVLALATKGVFLLLGTAGVTSLWLAILADDGITLVVLMNSLRLLKKGT